MVSPANKRARLSILIYHRVLSEPDPLVPGTIDARTFERQMAALARHFHVLPLSEAVRLHQQGCLPSRAAAITFDDGYEDNARIALPILKRNGVPACFFVATGFLDGGMMWNDVIIESLRVARGGRIDLNTLGIGCLSIDGLAERRAALRAIIDALKYRPAQERDAAVDLVRSACNVQLSVKLMMSTQDVQRLHREGMEIGGHTITHPILAQVGDDEARREILGGKHRLEEILGTPVELFAYPNGKPGRDYTPAHVGMVRELGFKAALSTQWGAASAVSDCYQLPRFTPWDRSPDRFVLRLYQNCMRGTA
ncbi:MAG: polysaccharide deacetylase [Chromatiales bacterium 21-64-14]|nr:MAG: polysaccharide deacetylase [Chromatiales bacterium 21-64-14]HQU16087.1 polysaccharide deacetylase family protein [Gammaproteobacteria bacterium]